MYVCIICTDIYINKYLPQIFIYKDYHYTTDGPPSATVGVIASVGTTLTPTTDTAVVTTHTSITDNAVVTSKLLYIASYYFTLVTYISSYVLNNS